MSNKSLKRPPNELESRLHKAAVSNQKNILTLDHAQTLIPDAKARVEAFNWLLSVSLFKPLHDEKGRLVAFRAVTKDEIVATKDLTTDEKLVLDHITGARNEGIWTKTLKAKTNLHQNVVDRCLKSLAQKKLIKRIPAMNNKKIYMLEGLEPSVELTGGAWYIDGELDTGLIHHLTEACLKIVREMTFPKRQHSGDRAIYPISNSPRYPNANDILKFIKRANITQVDLTTQDIESLLNVLVLDGEIEKLPATGVALWDADDILDSEGEETSQRSSRKKRKHGLDDANVQAKKRRKKKPLESSEGSSTNEEKFAKKSKLALRKKRKSSSAEDSSTSDEEREHRKTHFSPLDDEPATDTSCETNHKATKPIKHSYSPVRTLAFDEFDDGTSHVYRAVRQERVPLGWIEAPCCLCPSSDFCKDGGPVNPRNCVYYADWLTGGNVAAIEDAV